MLALRLDKIQTECKPVKSIIGQRNVQIITHMSRLGKSQPCTGSSIFLGPSLNRWRCEKVHRPKQAPKNKNKTIYIFNFTLLKSTVLNE